MKRILFPILSFLLVSVLPLQNGIAQELPDGAILRFGDDSTIYPDTGRVDLINSVDFSPDGKTLASGSEWGFIRLWNVEKKRLERTLTGVGHYVNVCYSPDGKILAGVGVWDGQNAGSIKLWDTSTWQEKIELESGPEPWRMTPHNYHSVAFSPDGDFVAASLGLKDNVLNTGYARVWIWDLNTGEFKINVGQESRGGSPSRLDCLSFSPDGNDLVVGFKIYNAHTGRWKRTLRTQAGVIAFSPDGGTLAIGTREGFVPRDGLIQLWDSRRGSLKTTLLDYEHPTMNPYLFDLEYSPDGKTLASASGDVIRLYDIETKEERQILEGHTEWATSISYSPDGNLLASGGFGGNIFIWDSIHDFYEEEEEILEPIQRIEDINLDGVVDIEDLTLVAKQFGRKFENFGENRADVNGDLVVDIVDLQLVAEAFGNAAAAPSVTLHDLETLTAADVQQWLTDAKSLDIDDARMARGIVVLEQLLASLTAVQAIPTKTELLPNYPNPFNPETWIPYHLVHDAAVTITIYDAKGVLVRQLDLGHQRAGFYTHREKAAYWDGRNEIGELVASGVYTYQLRAGDYVALRRMVILK